MAAHDYDVVIVGGGVTGLALACGIADSGWRIALIEAGTLSRRRPEPGSSVDNFDARVSALTVASQQLLDDLGAWSKMADVAVSPYTHMHVWDAEGTGAIDFDAASVHQPALGHIVENRITAWALQECLRGRRVEVIESVRVVGLDVAVDPIGCQVTLDDDSAFSAAVVVGADGARSPVRELAGLESREWDYGHQAIVVTIETEKTHADTAWQRFLPEGPLALLPLRGADDGGRFCSIVWSAEPALAESLLAMDDAAFRTALGAASEHVLGEVVAIGRRFSFPLRQRHARCYYRPGVVLLGDAAHTIHPLAGQGMNLGLKDVAALTGELRRAASRGLAPGGESVLGRYQRRRMGDNLAVMMAMEGFKRLFGERRLPVRWARNVGMSGLDRLDVVKRSIVRRAMGLA